MSGAKLVLSASISNLSALLPSSKALLSIWTVFETPCYSLTPLLLIQTSPFWCAWSQPSLQLPALTHLLHIQLAPLIRFFMLLGDWFTPPKTSLCYLWLTALCRLPPPWTTSHFLLVGDYWVEDPRQFLNHKEFADNPSVYATIRSILDVIFSRSFSARRSLILGEEVYSYSLPSVQISQDAEEIQVC